MDNFKEILIHSIIKNAPLEIIEFILEKKKNINLNFEYKIGNINYVPLFSAIANNNFIIADKLIKNGANINYYSNLNKRFIIYDIYNKNKLNEKNLKYILNKNIYKNICENLMDNLIKKNSFNLLEIILKHYKYTNSFILKCLNFYKNQVKITRNKFKNIIILEKEKIWIEEDFYKRINSSNEKVLPRLLFEYESCSDEVILKNRIIKYNLLERMIKANEYMTVEKILLYENFNYRYFNYKSILSNVITNNNLKMAKLLIKSFIFSSENQLTNNNNFDIRSRYAPYQNLMLNIVIILDNMNLVRYLINNTEFKSFLDLNIKDINGEYPIFTSIYNNKNTLIFKYLIKNGADCNMINNNGISLLSIAIMNNKVDFVNYLLSRNEIKVMKKDIYGNTPFLEAVKHGNYEITKLLFDYAKRKKIDMDINEKDINGNTPLISSINNNDLDTVMLLLNYAHENNKDINTTDKNGLTPLMHSYNKCYHEIFRYLLKYCDINKKDAKGQNILFYAIERGDKTTVENLIDMGVDINSENNEGLSIIDCAIKKAYTDIVRILLKKDNLLLNKRNSKGKTILINIISSNINNSYKKEFVDLLIKRGVNINLIDYDGKTALYYANNTGYGYSNYNIWNILVKNGAIEA